MLAWSFSRHFSKGVHHLQARCFKFSTFNAIAASVLPSNHKPSANQSNLPDLEYSDDIFNFTNGRFIVDEAYETSQRRVRFNVNELARVAATAVGSKICTSIKKYPDGMFSKAMLLTMDDGTQVVAKVPNPNAGLPHFTTASEVATMDFARNVLGNPVPKVLAWSSRASNTPVESEYIIMEKVEGVLLEGLWPSVDVRVKWPIVQALIKFQATWSSISFKKYGSLYYAEDLDNSQPMEPLYTDANGLEVTNPRFSVGPSTGRDWMDNGRSTINVDRGPWLSAKGFQTAVGNRVLAAVKSLPLSRSPITLCGPGTHQPSKELKQKALDCYMKLIPFLLPENESIRASHIWHSDLHVGNIFVDPANPTNIVGLIDWQSTELSPLYLIARQPYVIDYDGPPVEGIVRPRKPDNYNELDPAAKDKADRLYFDQSMFSLYNTLTHQQNPLLWSAFEFQQTIRQFLLLVAGNLFVDGEAIFLSRVVELRDAWQAEIPDAENRPFPLNFSASEREEIDIAREGVARGMDAMKAIRREMGPDFPLLGMVKPERYEETLLFMEKMKEVIIGIHGQSKEDREAWEREWPYGT